jgi:hypothetical protein
MVSLRIYTAPRSARHERDFLRALGETVEFMGHEKATDPEAADLSVVWGFDRPVEGQPCLFVESGWLPRWHYQVSWLGINAESHVAQIPYRHGTGRKYRLRRARALRYLRKLRTARCERYPSAFGYADATAGERPKRLPPEFILAPLQVETDRNLRHMIDKRMQGFIDRLSHWNPPLPILFRRHPAKLASGLEVQVKRESDRITDYRDTTVHAYLREPGCWAVVTLNSNVAHDALIWGVPVIALERGPWPVDGPFWCDGLPESWNGFERFARGSGMVEARLDYAALLMREQWTIERAGVEAEVARLIERAMGDG